MEQKNMTERRQTYTITVAYPLRFRKALANSLGRIGDSASLMEIGEFFRECLNVNIQAMIDEHLERPSSLKARVRRKRN